MSSSKVIHLRFSLLWLILKALVSIKKLEESKIRKIPVPDCDGCILFTRRSINITNSFSFSLYNLPFFILFFAAELSIILQRLILLHRSLRFNDRNSIIDCNFGNTWRVFGVQIIDKVARTVFHSLLLFLLR